GRQMVPQMLKHLYAASVQAHRGQREGVVLPPSILGGVLSVAVHEEAQVLVSGGSMMPYLSPSEASERPQPPKIGEISTWQLPDGKQLLHLPQDVVILSVATVRSDRDLMASGGIALLDGDKERGDVKVWDLHTGALVLDLDRHSAGVTCVQFSNDGLLLAS